jgi:acetyl esterase/lipase
MLMRCWIAFAGALIVTVSPCHRVTVSAQTKVPTEFDVVYGKAGDKELKLDLARPAEGKGPFPVVVCMHGGGWRMGNKRDMRAWIQFLAREGFVAASIGYRLAPDHTFPAQIEDCKTAVRFLRAKAANYDIDTNRFAALGYSAGGHLACLLGLTSEKQGFEGSDHPKESSKVSAVVDYFGPTDLTAFGKDETVQRGMMGPFIGAKFPDNPSAHEKASPIRYVSKSAPPFLIFHGTKDRIVPIEQSRLLAEKLKDFGAEVKLIEVPGEGHGWDGPAGIETTSATLKFLNEKLKQK